MFSNVLGSLNYLLSLLLFWNSGKRLLIRFLFWLPWRVSRNNGSIFWLINFLKLILLLDNLGHLMVISTISTTHHYNLLFTILLINLIIIIHFLAPIRALFFQCLLLLLEMKKSALKIRSVSISDGSVIIFLCLLNSFRILKL